MYTEIYLQAHLFRFFNMPLAALVVMYFVNISLILGNCFVSLITYAGRFCNHAIVG